jgi:magnesium transporter
VHSPQRGFEDEVDPEAISDLLPDEKNVLWLDVQDPTEGDLKLLREEFGFHELALEDVARAHQRAKVDQYEGYYFIVFYAFRERQACEVNLFVGTNYLVTVHRGEVPEITETVQRWRQNGDRLEPGVGVLVYSLLDAIVDGYFPVLDEIAERVEDLEEAIFNPRRQNSLAELFSLKKELLNIRRVLAPERDVLNVLVRRDQPMFGQETIVYFQDVYDHAIRVLDSIDLYRDQLSSTLEAYLSVASNRLNVTMKRMTALATILMSVTVIASIYGMNFQLKPFPLESETGFDFAVGLMVVIALVSAYWFRRIDWL